MPELDDYAARPAVLIFCDQTGSEIPPDVNCTWRDVHEFARLAEEKGDDYIERCYAENRIILDD